MRKILFLFVIAMCAATANAQYRDVKLPDPPKQKGYRDYSHEDKGFWFAVEAEGGSSIMEHKPNTQYVGATFTGGYRLNEYLRFGAGFGCRCYVNNASVRNADSKFGIPIFANVRGNIVSASERDGVPFWSLNVGGITNEGFYASPTIGYSFGGLRNNFLIGVNYTISTFTNPVGANTAYSYLALKLGYEF